MSFSSFQDLFTKTANRLNLTRQLNASQICTYAREYLKINLPKSEITVLSYKHQQITCLAPHPLISQQLNSHRIELINFINNKFNKAVVTKVIIRIHQQNNQFSQ